MDDELLSVNTYTANGIQSQFEISFAGGYLQREDVVVRVYDADMVLYTEPAVTFVGDFQVSLSPVPANGKIVKIYRNTPVDEPFVDFSDGSIVNEINLDTNAKQAIFGIAELRDAVGTITGIDGLGASIVAANAAAEDAEAAAIAANEAADAANEAAATAVQYDANGNVALGLATADHAKVHVQTVDAATVVRGIAIDHYAGTLASAGSYGLDIRAYPGADTPVVIHNYSNNSGILEGGKAMQIDHITHGDLLELKNASNDAVLPGSKGTANFVNLVGYVGPSGDQFSAAGSIAVWSHQNTITCPSNNWPLRIFGNGLTVDAPNTSTRGLQVTQAATGIFSGIFSGVNYGVAVSSTTDGGQTLVVTKNGTGAGSAVVIQNKGTDPYIVGLDATPAQAFAIKSGGYYVGTLKVVGARDTGWTAMTGTGSKGALAATAAGTASVGYVQAELQTALNRIAALEARLKSIDAMLIAHGLIGA